MTHEVILLKRIKKMREERPAVHSILKEDLSDEMAFEHKLEMM